MEQIGFLRRQATRFEQGIRRVQERRRAWTPFKERAVSKFQQLARKAQEARLFEFLYADTNPEGDKPGHTDFVTLIWGVHPTGVFDLGEPGKTTLDVEGDCALHYSQGPSGEVVCILYPFSSKRRKPLREYYLYWVYSSPDQITERQLNLGIRLLFSLAHYSRFAVNPDLFDRLLCSYLRAVSQLVLIWHADWVDAVFETLKKWVGKKIESIGSGTEHGPDANFTHASAATSSSPPQK
jgi:hypothetical protein